MVRSIKNHSIRNLMSSKILHSLIIQSLYDLSNDMITKKAFSNSDSFSIRKLFLLPNSFVDDGKTIVASDVDDIKKLQRREMPLMGKRHISICLSIIYRAQPRWVTWHMVCLYIQRCFEHTIFQWLSWTVFEICMWVIPHLNPRSRALISLYVYTVLCGNFLGHCNCTKNAH